MNSKLRISRHEMGRRLTNAKEKYGMYYRVNKGNSEFNKIVNDSIQSFRKIQIREQKEWVRELGRVNNLHRVLNTALTNLAHSFTGDIVYIDRHDYVRICKTISAFNEYISVNQLWKLKYDTLAPLELPKGVIIKCKCGVSE
jgi:hypothetical protein